MKMENILNVKMEITQTDEKKTLAGKKRERGRERVGREDRERNVLKKKSVIHNNEDESSHSGHCTHLQYNM